MLLVTKTHHQRDEGATPERNELEKIGQVTNFNKCCFMYDINFVECQ